MTAVLLAIGCVLLALLIAHWVRVWIKQRNAPSAWPEDGLDDGWHDHDDFRGI